MTRYPAAIGMKRAKDLTMFLWHSKDGGRLYESSDRGYYFCASCDAEGRDPYVGSSRQVSATWTNASPGPDDPVVNPDMEQVLRMSLTRSEVSLLMVALNYAHDHLSDERKQRAIDLHQKLFDQGHDQVGRFNALRKLRKVS